MRELGAKNLWKTFKNPSKCRKIVNNSNTENNISQSIKRKVPNIYIVLYDFSASSKVYTLLIGASHDFQFHYPIICSINLFLNFSKKNRVVSIWSEINHNTKITWDRRFTTCNVKRSALVSNFNAAYYES